MLESNPQVDILTEEFIPEYATFWSRFAAAFIDGLVLLIPGYFLKLFLPPQSELNFVFSTIMWWLYHAIQESGPNQATVGKKAMGIKVINMEGERISFANATGRHFGKYISMLIIFIGYLMMLWDDKNQTLHDKMAGTLVVLSK
jgi:uncharacterized RDD family membrane protein YckC